MEKIKRWRPAKIRGKLTEAEIKIIDIAKEYGTSRQQVNNVINHYYGSAKKADRIRRYIASMLCESYTEMWGLPERTFWERF